MNAFKSRALDIKSTMTTLVKSTTNYHANKHIKNYILYGVNYKYFLDIDININVQFFFNVS